MKPLDRAMIAWSKGNFLGTIGQYYFTRDYLFHVGNPICARFKDLADDPFLLRATMDFNTIDPKRHLKGRKWYPVGNGVFQTVREGLDQIRIYQDMARRDWRSLSNNQIYKCGEIIKDLREVAATHQWDIFISHVVPEDEFLMGAKHLLRGRAGGLTVQHSDQRGGYSLDDFVLHDDFGDALLRKMKDDGVALHDLELS